MGAARRATALGARARDRGRRRYRSRGASVAKCRALVLSASRRRPGWINAGALGSTASIEDSAQDKRSGGLPEVAPRRGFEPDDVAAEGGMAGVERQDLVFVVAELEAERQCHLDELLKYRALTMAARETHDLHRQRAGAAHDLAVDNGEVQRTAKRQRVDSRVALEPLVLERHDRGLELLGDMPHRRKAPLFVVRDVSAEERSVPRQEHRRHRHVEQRLGQRVPETHPKCECQGSHCSETSSCHGLSWPIVGWSTSTQRPAVRPFLVASYMASTETVGR